MNNLNVQLKYNTPVQVNYLLVLLLDVKTASGIKNIHFGLTHVHRCVLALYTQYFQTGSVGKNHWHITLVVPEQCHTN